LNLAIACAITPSLSLPTEEPVMNIETNEQSGISVVEFDGRLDTNSAPDAEKALAALVEGGATKILLNFEKLQFVSSAGLRVVLATAKKLKATGGQLQLCALNDIVEDIFEMSGFSTLFKIHKSVDEAVSGF
jgi:anti-sigma B factor antagonist